jgi:hypothetical protein
VAVAAPTATARPNQPCSCQSSRCFSLACRNRTSRNYYRLRKRKQVADGQELAPSVEFEGCPWPAGPSGLCVRCRCPCGKPRHGCSRLCRDCTEQLTDREDYINEHGVHCIVPAWPRSLQLCARWAWAIIMIPPLDTAFWTAWAREAWPVGAPPSVASIVWLFLGHCVKWPPAIDELHRAWQVARAQKKDEDPETIVAAIVSVIRALHGKPLVEMHAGMSKKRMHATTGIVMHAQWMGILIAQDEENQGTQNKRGRHGSVTTAGRPADCIMLGVRQSGYRINTEGVRDAVRLVNDWFDIVSSTVPGWPADNDVWSWASPSLDIAVKLRGAHVGRAGPLPGRLGDEQKGHSYLVKHFARQVLIHLAVAQGWPVTPPSISMKNVMGVTPDETKQLEQLSTWRVADVERQFGMNVLWISCWACLFQGMSENEYQVWDDMPEAWLMNYIETWEERSRSCSVWEIGVQHPLGEESPSFSLVASSSSAAQWWWGSGLLQGHHSRHAQMGLREGMR